MNRTVQWIYDPLRDPRQNRQQSLLMLFFYVMLVGVVVKLWIFTFTLHSLILTVISSLLSAILLLIFLYRLFVTCKAIRNGEFLLEEEDEGNRDVERGLAVVPPGLNTDEFLMNAVRLQAGSPYYLGRTPTGGWLLAQLSERDEDAWINEVMSNLNCFQYGDLDLTMHDQRKKLRASSVMPEILMPTSHNSVASLDLISTTDSGSGKLVKEICCTVRIHPEPCDVICEQDFNKCDVIESESVDDCLPKTCPVCLDDFGIGDLCVNLSCRHVFHKKCLSEWLRRQNNCPLCKSVVTDVAR